ncbi:uncharacterized protein LOC115216258 [Octopus sinensis]|uniref:Uncharacterized protein LOC115216258 n=1 Tax=Octopus sinensis TaxID=2607531 RepID=A0A7E6F5Q5_9MOLL|nr:uncharacterized protein LOC115216258 [Octopus sinensis]
MEFKISTQRLITILVAITCLGELKFALSTSDIEFKCPVKWFNIGYMCYHIVEKQMPWDLADDSCKRLHSNLVMIDDYWTNMDISEAVKKKGHDEYWIGFNRLGATHSNETAYWGKDSLSNTQTGFWNNYQPNVQEGKCSAVSQLGQSYKWSFAKCDLAKVFVCEMTACSKDTFRCNNGRCISKQLLCDGTDDCGDSTDEVSCDQQCQYYSSGLSGLIKTKNFPSDYDNGAFCMWRIEADVGNYVKLTFTEFLTENCTDVVEIFAGGDSETDSILLAKLSGNIPTNTEYLSYNNKMLLKFTSDLSDTMKGFSATWTAVSTAHSHSMLTATENEQILSFSDNANLLHNTWTLTTKDRREIVTLIKQDMVLSDKDEVIVYDGDSVESPIIGQYKLTDFGTDGPDAIMSTGQKMHILLKTRGFDSNVNVKFLYKQGCNVMINNALSGEIVSPGYYANIKYPNSLSCQWTISSEMSRGLILKFIPDLSDDDTLHVKYNNGSQTVEVNAVNVPVIEVPDGKVNVSFTTNSIKNKKGFKAKYSVDCPALQLNSFAVAQPPLSIWHQDSQVNISCANDYGFRDEKFVGNKSILLECQEGGKWSAEKIPKCLKNYCGPTKYIKNGFVFNATGAMVGDTATYSCYPGYVISGDGTITCTSNGTWEASPFCISSGCSERSNITNGQVMIENGNGTTVGSVLRYSCDPGYHIEGNPLQLCLKSRSWTGNEPTCNKFNCTIIGLSDKIPEANITQIEDVPYDETLNITCNEGYNLTGPNTIRCTENQTFSLSSCTDINECERQNMCEQICINTQGSYKCQCEKGYTLKADNSSCEDIDECQKNNGNCQHSCTNVNGSYTCNCNEGYALYKENNTMSYSIPAAEDGTQFGDVFYLNHSCVRVLCSNPLPLVNGFIQPQRKISRYGDIFHYSCKIGYQLVGEKTSVCQYNGTWSQTQPRCEEMKCQLDPLNTFVNKPTLLTNESIPYLGYLNFSCTILGKGTEYRQRQCLYDPDTKTTKLLGDSYECGFIDCGQPMNIGGSNITTISDTTYGSQFEMACSDMYSLKGNSSQGNNTVWCESDGKWDYGDLRCQGVMCEDPFFPVNGKVTVNTYAIGGNASYKCNEDGYQPFPNSIRTCVENNNKNGLIWSGEIPKCLDVKKPVLIPGTCTDSVTVKLYSLFNLTQPEFTDNSGKVRITVQPDYISEDFVINNNITIEYTATDDAGNNETCSTSVIVEGKNKPLLITFVDWKNQIDTHEIYFDFFFSVINERAQYRGDIVFTFEPVNKNATITQTCIDQYRESTLQKLKDSTQDLCALVAGKPKPEIMENTFVAKLEGSQVVISSTLRISNTTDLADDKQQTCLTNFIKYANDKDMAYSIAINISNSAACGDAKREGSNITLYTYCHDGKIPIDLRGGNTHCVKCPLGSYGTKINGVTECKPCPIGEYKDTDGNQTCTPCPANTSTHSEGSTNVNDCKDICSSGSVSSTKLPPCTLCGTNSYYLNATYCESCPPLTKNRNYGSLSSTSCESQCSKGHYSFDGFEPCIKCPLGYYTDVTMQTTCLECPDGTTTMITGATNATNCVSVEANICKTNPCANNGTCVPSGHSYSCNCTNGFTGRKCEKMVDLCAPNPCYFNSTCTVKGSTFECNCPAGTNGTRCEIIQKTCTPNFCLNGGICINKLNSTECHCPNGFTGDRCDTSILPCSANPCQNASSCENLGNERAKCNCLPGFEGEKCQDNIDDCASSPCLFNGSCTDLVDGFECKCHSGLSGKICNVRENPCNVSKCHGNVCIVNEEAMDSICSCNEDYTYAEVCQLSYESSTKYESSNPYKTEAAASSKVCTTACLNDNQCQSVTFDNNTNSCYFFNGKVNTSKDACCETFTKHCQNPTENYWSPWYTVNGSRIPEEAVKTLRDVGVDICNGMVPLLIQCRSRVDRAPFLWQQQLGMSFNLSDTCIINNESCNPSCPPYQLRFQCNVNKVMDQKQCFNKTPCGAIQCYNGGTCNSNMCSCTNGYSGEFCQKMNDNCDPNPCEGGTCTNLINDYQCNCFSGYEGKNCTNINDCANATCNVTGTQQCKDLVEDYQCICKPGYKGQMCNINIDDCASNPCLHGANCTDLENDFSCNCSAGWTGKRCENIDSMCQANTCSNNAQCIDIFQDFYCSCQSNTHGKQCNLSNSVCSNANPCINNATCIDKLGDVHCNCTEGFAGVGCELSVDYCKNSVCENGGKCTIKGNGYECKCPTGFSGKNCETNDESCKENVYCQTSKAIKKCSSTSSSKAVSLDHDLWFYLPDKRGMAVMNNPLLLEGMDLSMSLWINFDRAGDTGTFMNVFMLKSEKDGTEKKEILFRLSNTGMSYITENGSMTTIDFSRINDAKWHLVTLVISSANNEVDLRVNNFQMISTSNQPIQSPFNQTLLVILGCHFDPITDTAVINKGFYGYLSQLNIYNKSLGIQDLAKLASSHKEVLSNIVYGWGNYYVVQGARKRVPSKVGIPSSSQKTPVSLKSCPSTVHNYGSESSILLNWDTPVFSDYLEIKENYRPGTLVPLGRYFVTYQAKDKYGNMAFCNFKVYTKNSNCSSPEAPLHGSHQCNYNSWPYYSCTMSCNPGHVPVTEYPYLYTCGPSGSWNPKERAQPFQFPYCGESVAPTTDISMRLSYKIQSTNCGAAKASMLPKLNETMTKISAENNGILCEHSDCRNVDWNVNCTLVPPGSQALDFYVRLKNVSERTSGNVTAEDILRKAVIDDLKFDYPKFVGGATVIQESFESESEEVCDPNQSFINDACVICPLGTYFNASQKMCEKCPIGSYQDEKAQLSCKQCPNSKTTITTGSRNVTACNDACEMGYYFDAVAQNCTPCDTNSFQNETGQFVCKPCPFGRSTKQVGSTSESECSITCAAGFERTTNCTPCEIGYYREKNSIVNTCVKCMNNTITLTTGSTSVDQCNITGCIAGEYLEVSNNTCMPCPYGTYQNMSYQTSCVSCPPSHRTDITGAQDISKCKFFCPSGFDAKGDKCRSCDIGSYKDNKVDFYGNCRHCRANYTTRGINSTSEKDCNLYKCKPGQQPNANQTGCELCPPGTYQPDYEKESCIPCNANYSTKASGSINSNSCEGKTCCSYCESGYEKVASNSQQCSPCGIGSYKDNSKGIFSECTKCPTGKITEFKASTSESNCTISSCTPGFYLFNNTCLPCPINQYQNESQQPSCLPCPSGFITWGNGSSSCVRNCSAGEQSTSPDSCVKCAIGTYRTANDPVCIKCPSDFLTEGEGKTSAADCTIPPCNEGTYYNGSTCLNCTLDEYQDEKHQRTCKSCPTGKYTPSEGTKDAASCTTYCEARKTVCPQNAKCVNTDSGHNCTCIAGHVRVSNGTCVYACDTDYCLNGGTCARSPSSPRCICTKYYKGTTCEQELSASELSNNTTDIIIGTSIGVTIAILFLILLITYICIRMRKSHRGDVAENGSYMQSLYDPVSKAYSVPYNNSLYEFSNTLSQSKR